MSINRYLVSSFVSCVTLWMACVVTCSAQLTDPAKNNNPFAPNPGSRVTNIQPTATDRADTGKSGPVDSGSISLAVAARSDQSTLRPGPNKIKTGAGDPTSEYRIGVGDMIRIDVLNVKTGPRYYKIGEDGRIDFQLAGHLIDTLGQTTAELERQIIDSIKLYDRPDVRVQVREFASHIVSVRGAVEFPGDHQIQRDALPFFAIRAKVIPNASARTVRITRTHASVSTEFKLTDASLSDLTIYPGDLVEFR